MIEHLKNRLKSIISLVAEFSNDILFALCSVGIAFIGIQLLIILSSACLQPIYKHPLSTVLDRVAAVTAVLITSVGLTFYVGLIASILTKICKRAIFKLQAPSLASFLQEELRELNKQGAYKHILIFKLEQLKSSLKYERFFIIILYHTFNIFNRLSDQTELEEVNNKIDRLIRSVDDYHLEKNIPYSNILSSVIYILNQDSGDFSAGDYSDYNQPGSDPKVKSYLNLKKIISIEESMQKLLDLIKWSGTKIAPYLMPTVDFLRRIPQHSTNLITEIKDSSIYLMKYWQLSNLDHASAVIKRHDHLKGCFCPVSNALLTKPIRQRNGLIFQDTGPLNLLNISNYDIKVFSFICDLVKQTQHSEDLSNYQPPKHLNENPEIGSMTEKLLPINCEKIGDNEDAITCPISTSPISDPVVAPDNQTFERGSILRWFQTCEKNRNPLTSPLTREVFRHDVATNLFQDRSTYQINHAIAEKAEQSTFDAEKAEQSTTAKIFSFFGL